MTFFSQGKKSVKSRARQTTNADQGSSRRLPLWQAILLPIVSVMVFFVLLEGALALFGIRPVLKTEDPFVGFADNVPLFVPAPAAQGAPRMITARNKQPYFNQQSFLREKPAGTYRIFTLGGSTTYGRPYNDVTSFSGWLRELLPLVDAGKKWEVINAGGISYASYRVAHLMEELVNYQPDLFIVYTGHNEFLEERTYGSLREMHPVIRTTAGLLSRTRTWAAMSRAMPRLGDSPPKKESDRDELGGEVNTLLDQSAGLDRFTRDDALQAKIFKHFRISVERMAAMARAAGAEIVFVTPASSLNDCTPFKSEHTDSLDPEARQNSEQLLARAETAIRLEQWAEALAILESAVKLDPRHAALQYRRGQSLLAMERFEDAGTALRRARDEDVCPLRALTPIREIVTRVAREQEAPLVDYVALLQARMLEAKGYAIPGQEFFLDHVHPTIEGHKLLAIELVEALASAGILEPGGAWREQAIATATARIDGKVDEAAHALALANLARVLLWAGKDEEASRLAIQAREKTDASEQVQVSSASILTTIAVERGQLQKALDLLYGTLDRLPGAIEVRWKLGQILSGSKHKDLEKAAANLLMVCQQIPEHDRALTVFSQVMAQRGRLDIAYASAAQAARLNPKNGTALAVMDKIRSLLKNRTIEPAPLEVQLEGYSSGAPRRLVQVRRIAGGQLVPHGIEVEFYENGRLKSFRDWAGGKIHGLVKTWDEQGRELTSVVYQQGTPADV